MDISDYQKIRQLFDDYLRMYSSRDDRLTEHFSENFSGFTGGGDFLVKDREAWVAITRQDFTEVKDPLRIELKDLAIQSLSDTIAVTTGFFTIHLPIQDHILSRATARLVLIFRKESAGWKISHSSISIPYHLVQEGEVYPLTELVARNQLLEQLIAERTAQLSEANARLQKTNEELIREIAERKQAGNDLQQSNQKIEALTAISPDGIGMLSLDGEIQLISDKLAKLHGYSATEKDEQIGKHVLDFIDPSNHELLMDNIRKDLAGENNGKLTEYLAIKKDNSRFNIEVNSTVLLDPDGTPTSILYAERDISERKRAEAAKDKLEAQNRQLQKAESLGRMAGAIAHHFNNQLAAVIGNLELAMVEFSRGESPQENITAAMKASDSAAEMSSLMLTYLGQSFDKHTPMDLSDACRRTLPMLQAIMPKDMVLETDLSFPGPVIMANASQILQLLTNLITNAWEALGESRGAISLCVKTVFAADFPPGHRFPLDWQPQNDTYACLEVTDTGSGIENGNIEKVFDPFFSSKFTGRGMGLAVVLGIARAHNGVVIVESKPGRGSTFRVFFPVSGKILLRQPDMALNDGDALTGEISSDEVEYSGTVLLIEDEEMIRHMAASLLTHMGFSVLEAKDGVEGVEIFGRCRDEIRFVLCDLHMPRINGWETLTALRKILPDIPVVLTSGYDKARVMAGDHAELPQVFLGKPYNLMSLKKAIAQALIDRGHRVKS